MGLFSWLRGDEAAHAPAPAPANLEVDPSNTTTFSGDLETVPRNNTICYHVVGPIQHVVMGNDRPLTVSLVIGRRQQEGFLQCDYFQRALRLGSRVATENVHVDTNVFSESEFFRSRLPELTKEVPGSALHRTCPIVYEGCEEVEYKYVGGYDDFAKIAAQRHGVRP
ncbi:hypothetical protein AMAG_07394 [Allomyces macrogynus ATCC 38327]|uniref:Uncharacterized protein n=1 Tax=Allomyces macrogynus (strain ATCC 38327) TaxID=578462 RepID=A0A0L0SI71_ALLM3|nr:hypothetical protein AMAG_07394 [Allomyces macrogynus ATCC 38327]|eukprot:KNE62149.1 hypothetical protein AMAG_07394 [Allomyces macrogynus ATCC 38327]